MVLVAILLSTLIFSKIGHGLATEARLGLIFGIFIVSKVAVSAPVEWVIVGTLAGLVYSLPGGQGDS